MRQAFGRLRSDARQLAKLVHQGGNRSARLAFPDRVPRRFLPLYPPARSDSKGTNHPCWRCGLAILPQPRQIHAGRQSHSAHQLRGLFTHHLPGLIQRLISRCLNHILKHLAIVEGQRLRADRAGQHDHSAVGTHLDHAGTGIALGDNLIEAFAHAFRLFLKTRQIFHQTGKLTEIAEQVHGSSSPGASSALGRALGRTPNPSSTRCIAAPKTSRAFWINGNFSASSRALRRPPDFPPAKPTAGPSTLAEPSPPSRYRSNPDSVPSLDYIRSESAIPEYLARKLLELLLFPENAQASPTLSAEFAPRGRADFRASTAALRRPVGRRSPPFRSQKRELESFFLLLQAKPRRKPARDRLFRRAAD